MVGQKYLKKDRDIYRKLVQYGDEEKAIEVAKRCYKKCLESEDPETEGFLFERDIYRSLRDSNELNNPPTMEAISNMLQFLSSPLAGCVEKSKDGYYATGPLADVARKFAFYSRNCFED